MSRTIEHECFSNQGELTTDIMKDHIVPSLGIGATDTIKKSVGMARPLPLLLA